MMSVVSTWRNFSYKQKSFANVYENPSDTLKVTDEKKKKKKKKQKNYRRNAAISMNWIGDFFVFFDSINCDNLNWSRSNVAVTNVIK